MARLSARNGLLRTDQFGKSGYSVSSSFVLLVALASLSNLVAYLATFMGLSRSGQIAELNPFVQPGSLASLGTTEALIVIGSAAIFFIAKNSLDREVLQGMLTGIFVADAAHDLVLILTQNSYASAILPLFMAACLPSLCAVRAIGRLQRSLDERLDRDSDNAQTELD